MVMVLSQPRAVPDGAARGASIAMTRRTMAGYSPACVSWQVSKQEYLGLACKEYLTLQACMHFMHWYAPAHLGR
jgi:hypothetical protein